MPALRVKVAVPVGMFAAVVVSIIVAVQVEVCPGLILDGLHTMPVVVLSSGGGGITVIVAETVVELPL